MTFSPDRGGHMTDLELAAYLDHGLAESDRTRVEEHLADCEHCREQLVETTNILARVNRPRRIAKISAALAAAVVAVVVINPVGRQWTSTDALTRSQRNSSSELVAYGPIGEVTPTPTRFAWAAAPGALSYRFTLTSAGGNALWTNSTTDTTIIVPLSVRLQSGQTYYWISDAVTNDGRTPSTGLKGFTVRP